MSKMKNIAVMTSGGDAPGMNAAIRAVVRTALYNEMKIFGIKQGYEGMISGDIFEMQTTDVSNIISRGGTILKTARSKAFMTVEGRQKAYDELKKHHIDGLVLIGGDGTFRGATQFFKEHSLPAIGIPGTIDKDISGTDYTIGFDTAVNTAIDAIDKIRDTAEAHDRIFIVQVMGRDAGYIALNSGIACGAEDILIPERIINVEAILNRMDFDQRRKKNVHIIVAAEGDDFGVDILQHVIQDRFPEREVRLAILGHIQRGGSPTCYDRVQASKLGYYAVNALLEGKSQLMVGLNNSHVTYTPFDKAVKEHAKIEDDLLEMAKVLST